MLKDLKSNKSKLEKPLEIERESLTTKTIKALKDNLEKENQPSKDNKVKNPLLSKSQPPKEPKLKLPRDKPEEEVPEKDNNDLSIKFIL